MPTKRQVMMENKAITTRGTMKTQIHVQKEKKVFEDDKITFEGLKQAIINIEELYTDTSLQF